VSEVEAVTMAEAALEYRANFPGFRYREELLSLGGPSRFVYDNVKDLIHPYFSGATNLGNAPRELGELFSQTGSSSLPAPSPSIARGSTPAGSGGAVTFDSIWANRQGGSAANELFQAVEMQITAADGTRMRQVTWVGSNRPRVVSRALLPYTMSEDQSEP
jgi:hypothetical protein